MKNFDERVKTLYISSESNFTVHRKGISAYIGHSNKQSELSENGPVGSGFPDVIIMSLKFQVGSRNEALECCVPAGFLS